MTTFLTLLLGAGVAFALVWARARFAGFRSQKPEDYASARREFDLRQHLKGPILCEGVMTEDFRYDSGRTQSREWRLTLGNDGSIRAEADDLDGVGTGMQMGSAVQLNYRIRLPKEAGGHVLDTTDWMYLMDNGAIMNRSQFRKYGIKVAELVATMRPKDLN